MGDKLGLAKAMFGMIALEARERGICISCKQRVHWEWFDDGEGCIYSEAGKREYEISGMCEHCFDALFK